jgi:hypothetical protein
MRAIGVFDPPWVIRVRQEEPILYTRFEAPPPVPGEGVSGAGRR